MRILQPEGWPRPKGYANAIEVRGRTIYVAGLIGWNEEERFVAKDLPGQFEQILRNLVALLAEGGAGPEHVVRMTWYVTDKQDYLRELRRIGEIYRSIMGKVFPTMAVVQVVALMEDEALIEIETTAVVPD
ncbi:RidA family protein [Rhizorhabdus wittichii]|jgi:enamine deaminase RidA (YjgF/YER057c/UK114 family)|uniref:Endoribonuclease L-PSP n=2 Tax=Rhizorhabdus wittichii TaxID=160791 RepID=A0A9J9LCU6_RHIWR|nr:RidA family protein [Rhizorhabdus wittichii]ABQ67190.1 Endoribonuclease L-PSP [Rhizorhabdus wittichii RW1]ARR56036.1 enamine deaminase RidA [Rhizorhabdus wittichii DC-6]QTH23191.1 RidA family protein [Rhizorhabdus wittichii]